MRADLSHRNHELGDRDEMLALARERLGKLKVKFPKAELGGRRLGGRIFLTPFPPSAYYKYAVQFETPAHGP